MYDPAISANLRYSYPPGPESSDRTHLAFQREFMEVKHTPCRQYSLLQLSTAYRMYRAYFKVQEVMRRDSYHAGKIADAMTHLPNLEEIVLSLQGWDGGRSLSLEIAYAECHVILYGDRIWTFFEQSHEVFEELSNAVRNLDGLKFDLTAGEERAEYSHGEVDTFGIGLCSFHLREYRFRTRVSRV